MFCPCLKKNDSFLHFNMLCFFTRLLLLILYKQLSSCFQLSNRSEPSFRQVFDNLSQNLIIFPQHLDVLMISNLQFTRSLKFKPNLFFYRHDYPNTLTKSFRDKKNNYLKRSQFPSGPSFCFSP